MSIEVKNYYDPYIDITVDISDKAKEFYRWWIPALESGDFLQTRQTLRGHADDEGKYVGYCCLGVAACGLMSRDELKPLAEGFAIRLEPEEETGGLPQELQITTGDDLDWVRMDSSALPSGINRRIGLHPQELGVWANVIESSSLIAGNDDYDADFLAIARALRLSLVGKQCEAEAILGIM